MQTLFEHMHNSYVRKCKNIRAAENSARGKSTRNGIVLIFILNVFLTCNFFIQGKRVLASNPFGLGQP